MVVANKIMSVCALLIFFTTTIYYLFSSLPWLSLIPGIATIAYWNILYDKTHIDMYRYGDWFLTTPLMLLALLRQNNVTSDYTNIILILDMMMIGSGYFGVKEEDKTRKLAWFILGLVIFLPIAYALYNLPIEKSAALFLLCTWSLYPIIWLMRYNNLLRDDVTNISYTIMDIVAKVGLLSSMHI